MSEKGNILVIDDEESVRASLAKILQNEGHNVRICSNGQEALALISTHLFDLVITDLKMQGLDGIEVLEEVKKIQPGTLVIIITGYASLESAIASLRKGAFDYLVKPFQVDVLLLVVQRSIGMKRLTEKNIKLLEDLKRKNEQLAKANKELKQTQKKILEAERLAAISETIAAIHHEINNPLTAMLMKIQLLNDRYLHSEQSLVKDLKLLENLTLKVTSIIEKLNKITKPCSTDYVEEVPMLDIDHSN
ncbi:response regulator [candidate division CSSED10-310 bacterium]|uniref:Response regulator n=1 Tax=candidate division CSSED10-310 bacterium TaxID=2855610 RepID=A0ABV6YS53_UNCC1